MRATLKDHPVRKSFLTVKHALEKLDSQIRLHHHRIREYRPHVQFHLEKGHYIVKTAQNGRELEDCLKLRFEVFHREFMNKTRRFGVDLEKLDLVSDHLIIIDKRIDQIIGTYRLNSSRFTDTFYSAGEFQMDEVLRLPGHKLELGRACINRDYRSGVVIALLWRGIAEYINQTETRYLFGCASIKTEDEFESALLYQHFFEGGNLDLGLGVTPTKKYKFANFDRSLNYIRNTPARFNSAAVAESIPTLFSSYLRAGAKICGEPAYDADFHCIDFFTILRIDELNPLFVRKYKI